MSFIKSIIKTIKRKKIDVLYLCDGKKCSGVLCQSPGSRAYWADNCPVITTSECMHCLNVENALNGPIKGPINFLKRFRIVLKPWIHVVEKDKK